jgi:crotonobetainyl-CoA:carnitine CoA-transferase CaiB-like acyl-CoA transferase
MEELDELGTAELRARVTDLTQRDSPENLAFIEERFAKFLKSRTQQEIWDAALARRFMMFPINDLNDVVASPVHKDRAFFTDVDVGSGTSVRYPVRTIPGQATTDAPAAPQVGRETTTVLRELGFSDTQLATFRKKGVIAP